MQKENNQIQPVQTKVADRKVTRLILHQAFSIPGGSTESSLYLHKGYNMVLTSEGIECEYKGQNFFVPATNVVVAFFT